MSDKVRKSYELQLDYFNQGDDLGSLLISAKTSEDALRLHAQQLKGCAAHLEALADRATEARLEIVEADIDFIRVECDADVGDELVANGLLEEHENWLDESFDDEGWITINKAEDEFTPIVDEEEKETDKE